MTQDSAKQLACRVVTSYHSHTDCGIAFNCHVVLCKSSAYKHVRYLDNTYL